MGASILVLCAALTVGEDPTLLVFIAPNCPACRAAEPIVERLIDAGAPIETVRYDRNPALCRKWRVMSFPTFVLVEGDRELDRVEGIASHERLSQMAFAGRGERRQAFNPPTGGRPGARSWPGVPKARAETLRGQSPDEEPSSFLGRTFGRLLGRTGEPRPAGRGGDPFAGRRRQDDSMRDRSESSDEETPEISIGAARTRPEMARPEMARAESVPAPVNRMRDPASRRATAEDSSRRMSGEGLSPAQRALAASVLLKVSDGRGSDIGSGTIVHVHGDEALIVTCAHIFRNTAGRGRITAELFMEGVAPIEAELVACDMERDVALVAMRPNVEVTAAPVAPADFRIAKGDRVFSVGCDGGKSPDVRETTVAAINRYKAPPHYVVAFQPAQGRSGGGLFSADGRLIGVCNHADENEHQGLFAALPTLHDMLDRQGLTEVYGAPAKIDPAIELAASEEPTEIAIGASPKLPRRMPAIGSISDDEEASDEPAPDLGDNSAEEVAGPARARLGDPIVSADDEEADVICIVRSRTNPSAGGDVLVIRQASPELMNQLAQAAGGAKGRPAANERPANSLRDRAESGVARRLGEQASAPPADRRTPPERRRDVVRGQSLR